MPRTGGKKRASRLLKVVKLQDAVLKAKKMAEDKLARNEDADEFLRIAEADGFRIYVAVGKPSVKVLWRCMRIRETFS